VRVHWGFIPYCSAEPRTRYSMINAKCETAPTSRAFGESFLRRRCLILADGFYEWQDAQAAPDSGVSVPLGLKACAVLDLVLRWLCLRDGRALFRVATTPCGDPRCDPLVSCTILTAPANQAIARIHDRMPLVLRQASEDACLDTSVRDPAQILDLLEREHPGGGPATFSQRDSRPAFQAQSFGRSRRRRKAQRHPTGRLASFRLDPKQAQVDGFRAGFPTLDGVVWH
jgi:putative SOS response-associated peptidase YedK